MWLRLAAIAVFATVPCVQASAQSPEVLTLDDAFARVAQSHPDLRLIESQRGLLAAESERAALRPPQFVGLEVEIALGSGEASGFDGAEISLTLASVLERGGKLDARRTLVQSRIDALSMQRETKRLDLLAEVARRYLAVSASQHQRRIAEHDIAQRQRTVAAKGSSCGHTSRPPTRASWPGTSSTARGGGWRTSCLMWLLVMLRRRDRGRDEPRRRPRRGSPSPRKNTTTV